MGFFGKLKDWALSAAARAFIEHHIKKFGGHMITFKMDTQEKKIALSADLKGELQPVEFTIQYETYEQDGHTYFKADSIASSREWLTLVLAELIKEGKIPPFQIPAGLPEVAVKVLNV